ncbi:MAG TPA: adenylate/guanylate cyclase domain-containing protein [Steroidobacteraceae bacterium]|nr:adenylate/guanylate cyclase domain-containing protein [Steroidobacteraceae bacterium]
MSSAVQLLRIEKAEARSARQIALAELQQFAGRSHTMPRSGWLDKLRALIRRAERAVIQQCSLRSIAKPRAPHADDPDDMSAGADAERKLVAILISDIVESTACAARLGDYSWRKLLDRHDAATRQQIRRFGGQEIRNCGDGFLAIFNSATHAIHCAAGIAEAVGPLGICLRSGIHAGEVHLNGNEITGIAVHIAARIAAIALPCEIVVSGTVRAFAAGSTLTFQDLGAQRLRGVPEETRLFSMCLEDDVEPSYRSREMAAVAPQYGVGDNRCDEEVAGEIRKPSRAVPIVFRPPTPRPNCFATKSRQLGTAPSIPRAG